MHHRRRGSDGPDLGPDVDWRLSRVNLDEHEKGHKATRGRSVPGPHGHSQPSNEKTGPSSLPSRLAGRLVLASGPSAAQSAEPPPPPRREAVPLASQEQLRTVQRSADSDLRVVLTQSRATRSDAAPKSSKTEPSSSLVVNVRAADVGKTRSVTVKADAAAGSKPPTQPKPVAAAEPAAEPPAGKQRTQPHWRYKDARGQVRTCSESELLAWSKAGYFAAGLPVQRICENSDQSWTTLGSALKDMAPPSAPKAEAAPKLAAAEAAVAAPETASHGTVATEAGLQTETHGPDDSAQHASQDSPVSDESGWDAAAVAAARKLFGQPSLWVYRDPDNVVQGPFSGADMLNWFLDGYMHDHDLQVATDSRQFKPLHSWLSSA